MKKIIFLFIAIIISFSFVDAKETKNTTTPKKKGVVSKIGDAATRGYGWQLGKEAARSTINGVKKIATSDNAKKLKESTKKTAKKLKDKVIDGSK